MLDVLHHLASGIKAFATEAMYIGCDEMRQCCGGAGYLMSSGVAQTWADASPFPTFEGVNVVMY
jgi:acyl-CoA oxidase